MPGAGAIIAALVTTTGVKPLIIGKPPPAMFIGILERAAVGADEALVVGDNPDADVVAAQPRRTAIDPGADRRHQHRGGLRPRGRSAPTFVARDPAAVRTLLRLPVS